MMNKKDFAFVLKKEAQYMSIDLTTGKTSKFSPDHFTQKWVTSLGDVPAGSTTENCRVITMNPWLSSDLIHKGLQTKRLNDKLMTVLKTGEFNTKQRGPIILFKLDEMSSYWLYDGENLIEYTIEYIPNLLDRECHVLRNPLKMWDSDSTVLPSGPKLYIHENPDKFVIFCFCTAYDRLTPPIEIGPSMLVEISSMQGLETLASNATRLLGNKAEISDEVKLIAGYKTAKSQPQQMFYFSFCVFISAYYLTESRPEVLIFDIATFTALLSGYSYEDSDEMISKILESQTCYLVTGNKVRRDKKRS